MRDRTTIEHSYGPRAGSRSAVHIAVRPRAAWAFALVIAAALVAGCGPLESAQSGDGLPARGGIAHGEGVATHSPGFQLDLGTHSTTEPGSLWVVVNKAKPLAPEDYAPEDLVNPGLPSDGVTVHMRKEAAEQLKAMATAANADTGEQMALASGFRSFTQQKKVFTRVEEVYGTEHAETFSARPGHSEHQTGLVADLSEVGSDTRLEEAFAGSATGKWVAQESWKYGFIVRYPEGAADITGFKFEPWHVRYVGGELAAYMHENKIATLEEALKEDPAPTY